MAIVPFRQRIRDNCSPPFLRVGTGERYLYAWGALVDARIQKVLFGVQAHMPTRAQEDALRQIGLDRLMPQGPNESRLAYATRLKKSFEAWQRAGTPFGVLSQLHALFSPSPPPIYIVTDSGHWYWMLADGSFYNLPVAQRPPAISSNWRWDANTGTYWPRFWVIVDCSGGTPFAQPNVYGGGIVYSGGALWGIGGSGPTAADIITSMREIIALWKPAHSTCANIILDFTGHFQPTGSGAGYPAGNWDLWVNRWQPAAYLDGVT